MIFQVFSKREKYIFAIAIIFIAVTVPYIFIIEPGLKKWQDFHSEIRNKTAEMNRAAGLIEKKEIIILEYDNYSKSVKNIAGVLGDLENQAESCGIKTGNIIPGCEIEKGLYKECRIELQIEGEMDGIIEFLSGLAKFPNLAISKKINFKIISQNPPIFKGTIILSKIIIQ